MRNVGPVTEESGVVEDVHHLRLMALLHELVRERSRLCIVSTFGTPDGYLRSDR